MNAEFRELLEAGDFKGLRAAWRRLAPHLDQPRNDEAAEITMHMARTASKSMSLPKRLYSHSWLLERELPSQMTPVVYAEGVGVSVNFRNKWMQPAAGEVRDAMNAAINECYADRKTEPGFVKARMMAAKERTMRALFG